jgi:hypothetical protein
MPKKKRAKRTKRMSKEETEILMRRMEANIRRLEAENKAIREGRFVEWL